MILGTSAQLKSAAAVTTVDVAGSPLPAASQIKSLGVIIDSYLRFDRQAAAVAKACNYHIHALRHVRKLLTDETARTVACSIAARLDYCNAVLYGACHGGDAEQTTTCTEQPSQGGVLTWWPGRCSTSAQVTTLASA